MQEGMRSEPIPTGRAKSPKSNSVATHEQSGKDKASPHHRRLQGLRSGKERERSGTARRRQRRYQVVKRGMNRFACFVSALFFYIMLSSWTPVEAPGPRVVPVNTGLTAEVTPRPAVSPVPTPTPAPSRYAGIALTESDLEMLARLVWLEAWGESERGQVAVAEVVFNRVLAPEFPDTVETVIYAKNQFSSAPYLYMAQPTPAQYEAVWTAYGAASPVTELNVVYFSTEPQNDRVYAVIGGHYFCRI